MKIILSANPASSGSQVQMHLVALPEVSSLDANPVLLGWIPGKREIGPISTLTGNFTLAGNLSVVGLVKLNSYSASSLPDATEAELIFVSDALGGACVAYSAGEDWKRIDNNEVITT